jgi:hypothetical protein
MSTTLNFTLHSLFYIFVTVSHYVAQATLELMILLP